MNFDAIDELFRSYPQTDLFFIESGGDNLSVTFSPELADASIYVIDVAQGEKIPRKGGPGVTQSDLLVINKTDLAPHVGADLTVMAKDATRMRSGGACLFTDLKNRSGVQAVADWVRRSVAASVSTRVAEGAKSACGG
jgi:urease accessory protein